MIEIVIQFDPETGKTGVKYPQQASIVATLGLLEYAKAIIVAQTTRSMQVQPEQPGRIIPAFGDIRRMPPPDGNGNGH